MVFIIRQMRQFQIIFFLIVFTVHKDAGKQASSGVPSAAPGNFRVTSNSSLTLDISWDSIPTEKQNGKLLGYHIYYKVNGSAVEYNKTVGPDKLAYQLTGLEFTTYVVRMAGYTAVGVGLSTGSVRKQPKGGAPTAPRNLKLTVESSTSIKASWTKPLKINGVFKRYVVMYGLSKDSLSKSFYSFTTEYSLAPLDEFTTYYVQVHAETSVTGLSSDIISARTNEDAPSSAPIIDRKETKAEDAHTIRVKWNEIAKEDQNGFILGYAVLYKEKGQQNSFRLNTTSTDTIIRRLKPYTEYCIQVQGFTKAGESPFSPCFDVRTLDKGPSQPLNVQVQAVSSVAILVKWDAPAHPNGEIKEYIIFYGTSKDVQSNERKVTGSAQELIINGLKKYTTYYVKVRVSTLEPGNASEIFNVTTFEDSPGPPKEFRAQVVTANDVHLTWKKPDNSNGIVRFYYIKIYNTKTGLQFGNPINQSADERSHVQHYNRVIPDLKYYTDYTFTIQAVTVKPGEMANATARTEEGAPSAAPRNFQVNSSSSLALDISWGAIPIEKRNGKLLGYYIYYRVDGSAVEYNKTVGPDKLSDQLTGLEFRTYVVRIAGYTAVGVGLSTRSMSQQPKAGTPTVPRNLKLTVESSTSINASWTEPLKFNGVFKHYVVMYGLSKDGLNTQVYSRTTKYSLTELNKFTTYYVQVHAETSVSGPTSDIISAKTDEDAPSSAPEIDKKETRAEDAHTIRVQWNEIAKEDQNGLIYRYDVLYQEKREQNSISLKGTTTNTIIRHLKPYTLYCIKVQGFTKAGKSPISPCFNVTTLNKGPSQPLNVQVQAVSSVSILVKWDAPAHPNGEIKEYTIFYGTSKDVQSNERKVNGSTWEDTIDGLKKYTTYYVKVRGSTSKPGNASEIFNVTTFEDSPGSPKEFRAQVITANEVHLTWKEPVNSNGIVRFYYIKIYNTETGLQFGKLINESAFKQSNMQQHNKLISDLKYFTDYTFTIQAVTVKPGEMANATARTEEGVPSQPRDVAKKLEKGEISVTVTWKDPKDHNGIITMYTVYFEGKRAYDPSFTDNHEIVSGNTSRSTEIGIAMLKPGTEYSIYVKAKTVKGYGAESDRVWLKRPSKRPPPPKRPQVVEADVTTTTITISLSPSNDTNGEIIRHQIIVEMLETARARRETTSLPVNIYDFEEAETNGDRFYIAAMFERRKLPAEFVLGNGKTYGGYENVPLKPGTRYKVYVRGVTERDGKWLYGEPAAISLPETDESPVVKEGDNMVGVIAGVLGVLILIVIAIIAFHLYQRSNRPPNANLNVESQNEEFELRRSNARVTTVESDQTQENLTLVPVGVTTQLMVSESNEHHILETEESSLRRNRPVFTRNDGAFE